MTIEVIFPDTSPLPAQCPVCDALPYRVIRQRERANGLNGAISRGPFRVSVDYECGAHWERRYTGGPITEESSIADKQCPNAHVVALKLKAQHAAITEAMRP